MGPLCLPLSLWAKPYPSPKALLKARNDIGWVFPLFFGSSLPKPRKKWWCAANHHTHIIYGKMTQILLRSCIAQSITFRCFL